MSDQVSKVNSSSASILTTIELKPGCNRDQFLDSFMKLMVEGARAPGFWSAEILHPGSETSEKWQLRQSYSNNAGAQAWQSSEKRKEIVARMGNTSDSVQANLQDEFESSSAEAATAIVTEVKTGMEERYFEWEIKMQLAQAKFKGYRGSHLLPPSTQQPNQWATLLRFDSPESLDNWFKSSERKALLQEAEAFVTKTRFKSISTSFPGWVPVDPETGEQPANWKTWLLVLTGLFPVVILEIKFTSPLMTSLNRSLSTFLNLAGSVAATTWLTMPFTIPLFTWWLFPKADERAKTDLKGGLYVVGILAFEVALFWQWMTMK